MGWQAGGKEGGDGEEGTQKLSEASKNLQDPQEPARGEGEEEGARSLVRRDFQGPRLSGGPNGSFAGSAAPGQGEDNNRANAREEN